MDKKQIYIMQELGKRYAEAAAMDVQNQKIRLWQKLNGLKETRPMVMIDQLPWNELNNENELTLLCTDPLLKFIEREMRQTLYKWKHFKADMVVPNRVDIPKFVKNTRIGPDVHEDVKSTDPANSVKGHRYYDLLPDEQALDAIETPTIITDPELDRKNFENVSEVFQGILPVRMSGITVHAGIWDRITTLRGADAILYDLADRPEFVLKIVNKFVDISMNVLDQFEKEGLLDAESPLIHCTGAFTDELPGKDYNGSNAKAKDCWSFGMSQIFSTVSPGMHDEFEIEPLKQYLERFGLMYYGCCEPLDMKIDIIRKINNVRKISVSPWADKVRAAKNIHGDYVFSNKPNPAFLAGDSFYPDEIKKDLQETVRICKEFNTPCELILKDVSTVRYKPERLAVWEKIAMEVVNDI